MSNISHIRRGVIFALLPAVLFFVQPSDAQDWSWQNPFPQGNTLYGVATPSPGIAVMVGGQGVILTTNDGGVSWNTQYNPPYFTQSLRSTYFINQNTGWIAGDSGIVLSTKDGGSTWRKLASLSPYKSLSSVRFTDIFNGWVIGDSGLIYATHDSGTSWVILPCPVKNNLKSIFMFDSQHGWIVGLGGTILNTSNGGTRWDSVYIGPSDFFSVSFMNSDTGWIGNYPGNVFRTTDKGVTWNRTNLGSSIYSLKFIAPRYVYGVGGGAFTYSADAGRTWNSKIINSQSFFYDLSFRNTSSGWVVGFNGEIDQTVDSGKTWIRGVSGPMNNLNDIAVIDSNVIMTAGDIGTLLRSVNGGNSFSKVFPDSFKTNLSGVCFPSSTTGWVVGDSGKILKSQNGGLNWISQISGTTRSLNSVSMADNMVGWAGGNRILLRTVDGGVTWVKKNLPDTSNIVNTMHFTDSLRGVILATGRSYVGNSRILYTSDGGFTWIGADNFNTSSIYSMYFLDPLSGWAVGSGSRLLQTHDGGVNWSINILPISRLFYTVFFADGDNGWLGTNTGMVIRTTDGGSSWSQLRTNSNNVISKISFYNDSVGWVIGSLGMIIKTTTGGGTGIFLNTPHTVPKIVPKTLQSYPNPFFHDSTWIPFHLATKTNVIIKIYDMQGRFVRELNQGMVASDRAPDQYHTAFWDGRDQYNTLVSSGIYFYQIITDYTVITGKMVLMRCLSCPFNYQTHY
ncbi:MAG: YCF48-related protein [Bacteroidota bacterium]